MAYADQEEEEDLQLALALSASEASARGDACQGNAPAMAAAPPAANGSTRGPVSSTAKGGLGLSRLADGFKRLLRPPAGSQQQQQQPAYGPPTIVPQVPPQSAGRGGSGFGDGYGGGSGWSSVPPQAPNSLDSDEALARALQEQFDREQQQQPPGPAGRNSGGMGFDPTPSPPSGPYCVPAASAPHAPLRPQPPVLSSDGGEGCCAGCGQALLSLGSMFTGGGRYLTALGRSWHPGCFVCAACRRPLAVGGGGGVQFSVGNEDGLPYHTECHRERFHPRCRVCAGFVPEQGAGRIVWSETPFWKDRYCPLHNEDGTRRCTGCTRLQPQGEQWADLDDGRCLCLDCLNTLVADTADCQPLWDNVLRFYADMGMALPVRPPMMLVESGALNQAERSETHGAGRSGPVFHTRGLCLTEEYTSFRTVVRVPRGGGGGLLGGLLPAGGYSLQPQTVQLGPTRTEVTAILVLYGMPWLLTGSVLAHEAMHAWLRLSGYRGLAPEVEEGLCQLMALLWLEARPQPQRSYEDRLASFLANQIRTDPSPVYGDGFRAALEAYQRHGLQTVLAHLRQAGRLPC